MILLAWLMALGASVASAEDAAACAALRLRPTPAPREGYACQALADGLALCLMCGSAPITDDQLRSWGVTASDARTAAAAATAAVLTDQRPLRVEIPDMDGRAYFVSQHGDGLDAAALLHPERLAALLGQDPVIAVPAHDTLIAWVPGDSELDKVVAVGVKRAHEAAVHPVSEKLYQFKDGEWIVWGQLKTPDPLFQR
ncbi:MAG: hypothetical protein AAFV53_06885 [Myxococcota bacterium]